MNTVLDIQRPENLPAEYADLTIADCILLAMSKNKLKPAEKKLVNDYKKIVADYKQPEDLGKRYSLIQAVTRPFTKEELAYWNQYHQSLDDLKANNVYSISKVYLNKQLFSFPMDELKFGYLYGDKWKIYRPHAKDKKSKWVPNNVPITAMDGKDDIKQCDVAFINKSKKDYMVMKKLFPCSCAVQNEA